MDLSVDIRGVQHRFGRRTALHDIDLAIGPGVFGLMGPNGAGKTTLLRLLATALQPQHGELQLLGLSPTNHRQRREIRQRLGYLPQQLGFYPNFTVAEFVEYFALLKEVPSDQVRPTVAEAIEKVDLASEAHSKLKTLSGGMLRRVGIAQAIVNRPSLLLLDEPTAGLDPEQRVAFRGLLRDIGKEAVVIVSTHLIEDVAAACDEVALLSNGQLVYRGTPTDLAARGEDAIGDTPIERGYSRILALARA